MDRWSETRVPWTSGQPDRSIINLFEQVAAQFEILVVEIPQCEHRSIRSLSDAAMQLGVQVKLNHVELILPEP